jgi:hypothetical protein
LPASRLVDNLVRIFGLGPADYDGICDATRERVTRSAEVLGAALNDKAVQIHLPSGTSAAW